MKHYLIYQIRNKLNGMIYIGQHQTNNINDGYMGSGIRIVRAIKKYGVENFEKTILFECTSVEEMNAKEAEIVNEDFIARDDVYNINVGGAGSWDYLNSQKSDYGPNTEKRHNAMCLANKNRDLKQQSIRCKQTFDKKRQNTSEWQTFCRNVSNGVKQHKIDHPEWMVKENHPMFGKHHSKSSKQKMSIHAKEHNSMHGKMWICNFELEESKVWKINEPIPDGWVKGRHSKQRFKKLKQQAEKDEYRRKQKLQAKENKLKLYREMFEEFKLHEFAGVVKKFGYTKTRNNLIMIFKAYIPEYIPKKCNRWKNRKECQVVS